MYSEMIQVKPGSLTKFSSLVLSAYKVTLESYLLQ